MLWSAVAALVLFQAVSATRDGATAASTSIRLRAYVPVFCALKPVPYFSNTFGPHGSAPKVKVVCNTPYHMQMDGKWDAPGRPYPSFGHGKDAHGDDGNHRDVEMHVTGPGGTQQALCSFSGGRERSCRTLIDNDGGGPPRVGEVTFGRPSYADNGHGGSEGGWGSGRNSGSQGFNFSAPGSQQAHWGGRMSLGASTGALPQVASADQSWSYLPSFLTDLNKQATATSAAARSDGFDDGPEKDAEQMTLSITVTGRY